MVSLFFCWFVSLSFFVYSIVCLAKIYIVCAQWLDISQKFCTNICSKYLHKYLLKIFAQICAQNISLKIAQTVLFFFSSWVILMKQSNQHRNVAKRTTRALVISGHWGAECFFQPMIQMFFSADDTNVFFSRWSKCFFQPMIQMFFQPMIQMFFSQWSKCFFSQWCKCFFSQWFKCFFFSQWSKSFLSFSCQSCLLYRYVVKRTTVVISPSIFHFASYRNTEERKRIIRRVRECAGLYEILQDSTRIYKTLQTC